jgi:hypothetical protein
MVGDGSRCLWGYNFYPFRLKRERAHPFLLTLLQASNGMESSCVPFFYFYSESGKDQIMSRAGIRISDATALKMVREYDLLLEELQTILEEELLAIYFLQKRGICDPKAILKYAIRMLGRKNHRTMRQDAVLAYAKKQLRELSIQK